MFAEQCIEAHRRHTKAAQEENERREIERRTRQTEQTSRLFFQHFPIAKDIPDTDIKIEDCDVWVDGLHLRYSKSSNYDEYPSKWFLVVCEKCGEAKDFCSWWSVPANSPDRDLGACLSDDPRKDHVCSQRCVPSWLEDK